MTNQVLHQRMALTYLMFIRNQIPSPSMERESTVTGKKSEQQAVSSEQSLGDIQASELPRKDRQRRNLLTAHRSPLTAGFTLLELMIVISILIILVSVVLPPFQNKTMHLRD